MQLSDEQYDEVFEKIESVELQNYQLKLDLLDHIACSIEELMVEGQTFEEAANMIFNTFNRRHLKKIEYTTERLTMNNMKKHTRMLGILGLTFIVLGGVMKIQHLQGAAIMLGIGVLVTCIGFFGSNAVDTVKNLDSIKGKLVQIVGAIGAIFTLGGGFFKIMHLPGAGILLGVGPVLLLVYFSFSAFLRTKVPE